MKKIFKAFWLIISILALNAGIMNEEGLLHDCLSEENQKALFSNVNGIFYAIKTYTVFGARRYAKGETINYNSPAVTKNVTVFADVSNSNRYCINRNTGALLLCGESQHILWLVSPIITNDVVYTKSGCKTRRSDRGDKSVAKEIRKGNNYVMDDSLMYSKGNLITS